MPGTDGLNLDLGSEKSDGKMTNSESPLSAPRQDASRPQGQMWPGTKPWESSSDTELIQRILGGEEEAFRELLWPYESVVFMTARAILHNDCDAEDAAQEAVLRAFSNLANFRRDAKFSTWLIRIVTNEALMKLRKERRRLSYSLDEQHKDDQGEYTPRNFADWREIPSEALQQKELREVLLRGLGSLTRKRREVFVLRDVWHLSIAETANLLGLTKSTVKARLLHARLQMRDALAPGIDGKWNTGRSESKQVR